MSRIQCYLLQATGEMTPFVEGISSPIMKRADTGELYHCGFQDRYAGLKQAGPGAMWFVEGSGLVVRTPGGDWHVDQGASGGGRWTRSGEPPSVTAHPSIRFGGIGGSPERYHGWLKNGWLEEC